nr:PREDICTED: actin-like [Latimeria chalumnae]|eukprot:XP_014341552.1 PREDICTED: actin-like [Latimeria chalumnae]
MTEPPNNPHGNRKQTAEILFESFQIPFLFLEVQAVLALHAVGKVTGTVIDSGSAVTHVVPIVEGIALQNMAQRIYLGGQDLTEHMMRILSESNNWYFASKAGLQTIRKIKEKLCYVALDYSVELQAYHNNPERIEEQYELPDGQSMIVRNQKFTCPEAMFKPAFLGKDIQSLPLLAHSVVEQCGEDIKSAMYANIVLAGGNTMFPNMGKRCQKELLKLAQPGTMVSP